MVAATLRLTSSALGGVRVLVVEDEPEARDSMRMLLQRFGAEVGTAGSARQALEAFSRGMFDVVISDIAMPGGDGYELMRSIRALAPEQGGRIPAVAVTARARPEDRRRALAEGFQVHLPKPVDAAELLERGLATAVATDAHHLGDLQQAAAGLAWIEKKLGHAAVVRLFDHAPRAILAGELPD